MREIKFRAWDDDEKKMHTKDYEDPSIQWAITTGGQIVGLELNESGEWFEKNLETIIFMQYTGLKDKNGKDIYEGDLVKIFDSVHEVKFGIGTYDSGYYLFHGWHLDYDHSGGDLVEPEEIEVIGNIYETLELIEEKND